MNNLIKYLLYVLVILLLVSWLITVGKSCGEPTKEATDALVETPAEERNVLDEVEDSVSFAEELESILDEEESGEAKEEEAELDYSSYDPKEEVVEEKKPEPKPVEKKEAAPAPSPKPKPAPKAKATSSGSYMIIVGSYIDPNNADRQEAKVKSLGYPAETVVFDLSQYYTVLAGRYTTYDEAASTLKSLKSKGLDGYVKKQTF
jgi:cell division protein FtsN